MARTDSLLLGAHLDPVGARSGGTEKNDLSPPAVQRRVDRGEALAAGLAHVHDQVDSPLLDREEIRGVRSKLGIEDLGLAGGEGALQRRADREGDRSRRRLRAPAARRQSAERGEGCPSWTSTASHATLLEAIDFSRRRVVYNPRRLTRPEGP